MLFSSITFLYYFLPITMLVYFIVPEKGKNVVLLAASFFFYFWGEPRYWVLLVVAMLVGYFGGLLLEHSPRIQWLPVGAALGILLLFKYADFLLGSINAVFHSRLPLPGLALPLGISFYTFQIISYLLDVRNKRIKAEHNLLHFATYVLMFPQLVAGPIVRYSAITEEMRSPRPSFEAIREGGFRFACGLAKKVLIADMLSELVSELNQMTGRGTLGQWLLAVAFTLQIYYDFSGYSDMAVGLGRMFGFTFPENFLHPMESKSVTEFWQRWHRTLGTWFRDYVYIPMGGNRVSTMRWMINVLVVWLLSGLWHGAAWNYAIWGLYFAAFLLLERGLRRIKETKIRKNGLISGLGHLYTVLVVVVSFVIFRQENLESLWMELRLLFWGTKSSAMVVYELKNYVWLLVIATVGATSLVQKLAAPLIARKNIKSVLTAVLFLVVTAFLIGSSSHPFLYFRF